MPVTKLQLYNSSLRRVGERKLSTETDNVSQRFHLDTIWDEDPIGHMLESYNWLFAHKAVEWNYNAAIDPDFGYQYAFDIPSDYVRLAEISADGYFHYPLRRYTKEGEYFFCDLQTIYLKYVSDDTSYGKDYSKFTKSFEHMVATYMAMELCPALNKSDSKRNELKKMFEDYERQAKNIDYMELPTRFPPQSSWARARRGSRGSGDSRHGPVFG